MYELDDSSRTSFQKSLICCVGVLCWFQRGLDGSAVTVVTYGRCGVLICRVMRGFLRFGSVLTGLWPSFCDV